MKKLLSVLLAVLMLFGAVSMSVSAAYLAGTTNALDQMEKETNGSEKEHVVMYFQTAGFATKGIVKLYDASNQRFVQVDPGHKEDFWLIPEDDSELFVGATVMLPTMQGTEYASFDGWRCTANRQSYVAGVNMVITDDMVDNNGVVAFEAIASSAQPPEDTMGTIMGILSKVFGAIIGLLFYNGNTEAGVQMVQELLGGILG